MRDQGGASNHAQVTAFLRRLRPESRVGFLAARALAISLGPDVTEAVQNNEVAYLRRDNRFITIRAGRSQVVMLFPVTIPLPDPMGRLLRRGEERYVVLDEAESLDGHVQEFVRRAYAAAR